MIPIETLKNVKHLVTHTPTCHDAIASALIIKDVLPDVRVTFMNYNTKEHESLPAEPGMIFCDFSPPPSRAQEFVDVGAIVLDHHSGKRDLVEQFGELGIFGDSSKAESGAVLARDYVWQPFYPSRSAFTRIHFTRVDELARLVAIRDTWQTQDPRWEEACDFVAELCFWRFENIVLHGPQLPITPRITLARRLKEQHLEDVRYRLNEAWRFETKRGTKVVLFEGMSPHASDAAEMIDRASQQSANNAEAADIVAAFHYFVENGTLRAKFSCRSHTGYDVSKLAAFHRGGGHKEAASFTVDALYQDPCTLFDSCLELYEA
jgi:hypothetical protein